MIPLEPVSGFGDRVHVNRSPPLAKLACLGAVLAAILAADLMLPAVPAIAALYVVPVLLAARLHPRALLPTALVATLLVLGGLYWSTDRAGTAAASGAAAGGANSPEGLASRLVAVILVCGVAALLASPGKDAARHSDALADSIDAVLWEVAGDTLAPTYVSGAAERMLGAPPARFLGEPRLWEELIDPADRARAVEARQALARSGTRMECEYRMTALDGRVLWVRDVATASGAGHTRRLHGVLHDVTEARRAGERLAQSAERLRVVVSNAPVVLFALDREGVFTLSEGRGLEALGIAQGEVVGKSVFDLYASEPEIVENVRRALKGESFEVDVKLGGAVFETRYTPLHDGDGALAGTIGVATDVTSRERVGKALREIEARYVLATSGANDGIWDWDLVNHTVHYSDRWKTMLGYRADAIEGRPEEWLDRVHPDDSEKLRLEVRAHLDGNSPQLHSEHRVKCHDGSWRWMLARGIAVRDAAGTPLRMAGSQTDITDRKVVEQRLTHNAIHDALTGLPNRALFVEHLDRAIDRAQRHDDYRFAVLFIDLDRLKVVNDSLGHLAGDQLLLEVGQRLQRSLRPGDLAARFGGDEFAVLVDDIKEPTEAIRVADRIHSELKDGLVLGTQEVFTQASIGVALSSSRATSPDHMLRDADTAMYRAKALGGGRNVVFQGAMHTGAMQLLELESDLRRAFAYREVRLQSEYQPIVSLETGKIVGFEALGRWLHPTRGIIAPSEFIPLAEETGLIVELGRWMLEDACRQMNIWRQRFDQTPLTISVNLSSKQLARGNLVETVREVLEETGLPPSSLNLEITESALMETPESATETFRRLKELGVRLQLDDFGTGYSSLSYLCRFPLDTLKIDRSFVEGVANGGEPREVVRTIITLARHLGLSVVAEGVETVDQLVELRGLACTYAQGYHFSRPLGVVAAEALLVAQPRW